MIIKYLKFKEMFKVDNHHLKRFMDKKKWNIREFITLQVIEGKTR